VININNPAEAAILGSNRNDDGFHHSVHHSHSYSSILVALSNNVHEGMKIMAIGKEDTSIGNFVARTHFPTFDGRCANDKLFLTKGGDCHLVYQVEVGESLLHVSRRDEQGNQRNLPTLYKECSFRVELINSELCQKWTANIKWAMVQWTLQELTLDKHMGQVMT
jgi:hypothetical protein